MSFIETPTFPLPISRGAVGGPEYKTDVTEVNSGHEQRNIVWSQGRARYQVEMPLVGADKEALVSWFRSLKGAGHGFRLRDWTDYLVSSANGKLGPGGVGAGVPAYQLYKYYSAGTLSEYRKILKPVSGSVLVYRNGVLQTAGSGAGQYALDTTSGVLTFVSDALVTVASVVVGATTSVTLSSNLGLVAGKLLYLTGFAGADAALLNSLAHSIVSVSGAGPYVFTLATNTAGKTITLLPGTTRAYAYPQASDPLTWTGEFDVPVRFEGDYLALREETPRVYFGTSITLLEIRNP